MLTTLRNAFKIPELRKKLLYTAMMLVVIRFGSLLPIPGVDKTFIQMWFAQLATTGDAFNFLDALTGGSFTNMSIFALSITPYITSSIIMQLLTIAIPKLEEMQKDGEDGRKKIAEYTRYVTVLLALIQSSAMAIGFGRQGLLTTYNFWSIIVVIAAMTAGSALLMWIGEQITQNGIGNGISILLFAGIVAILPSTLNMLAEFLGFAIASPSTNGQYFVFVPLFVLLFLVVIWIIVFMQDSERRIPVQYAKRVVGRKMYGGQSSHIPIKVAMSGVMPIIFASCILSIPSTIEMFMGDNVNGFWAGFFNAFSPNGWLYSVLYFLLIIMFAYFYLTIQYNPVEMANNLRQNNGTIPGIRPGKPTSDFISKILSKITLIGALFLALIALLPIVYAALTGMSGLSLGGTSILIIVGVALETMKQLESQMLMRHYKGFLD